MMPVSNLYSWILLVSVPLMVLAQTTNNDQCLVNKEVVVSDADVRFAFMMSLRKNDQNTNSVNSYTCSILSREPLQNYLAAEWVVERLNKANNGTGYIPGVKIGFYGMDDCRSAVYSSRNALSFLDVWVPSTIQNCTGKATEALHFGLIGPSRSATATRVASLLRDVQVPIISMAATSAELSNTNDYPTFFRTVPSDKHQVNMIVQILEQLSWTFVAVVYSNDEYGSTAANMLSDIAAKKGICISRKFSYGAETTSLKADLLNLIKDAKGNSVAVPFIGTRDKAENFLFTLNTLARVDGKYINHGFRLILSESTNTDVTIYNLKDIGYGTMAIGASNVFLKDLYEDLTAKVDRVKAKIEGHKLIEQYLKENNNNNPLISPNTLDTFVPQTVHAVFGLVEALRMEHLTACGGQQGVCSALRSNVEKGNMLDQVKKVLVDYKSMERGVPPDEFRDNNYTISFDSNGDIRLVNKNPAYTLYQYRGQEENYVEIGNYIGGQTIIEMDKMKFVTPSGQPSNIIPTSMCSTNCADCLSNNIIPMAFLEGDVYILGVFSIHGPSQDNPFGCGNFRSVGNDAVAAEGFLYAISDLRNKTGINFGAIAIDDCYNSLRITSILSDYFSGFIKSNISIFKHQISRDKLAGVVGCRSSGCTIPTAQFFMPMKVPVVSYASSSPDLDDKTNFPYFLRTVPSDVYQAEIILEIIKAMKWEYVGLVYVKNNYGTKAMEEFKRAAMKEGSSVCVAPEFGISEVQSESDSTDFRRICIELLNQSVKVVVFFGIDVRYRHFLSFMEKEQRYGKFIFIGSEDWGVNREIYDSGPKSARGSLTLKVQDIQLDSDMQFRQHLASKIPTANDSNIWFTEFWQNVFSCNIKGGFINTFDRDCDSTLKLSQDELNARTGEQRVKQVINAAYALGWGLKEAKPYLCEGEFPCPYFYQNTNKVTGYIKKQTRQQGNLKYNVFDSRGNGALGFDIFSIQQDTVDGNPYVKVGTFNSRDNSNWNAFQKDNLKFYTETGVVMTEIAAKCTEALCQHCPAVFLKPGTDKSEKSSVSEYRQSDILLISLVIVLILAVLVAIAAFVVCFTKKYRGLKKTIQSSKEKIYEEPDKAVYQEYADTHGIVFANTMNPYPIMSSVGLNNGGSSASDANGGINNPAFMNDIDSVSQIIAMRNQKQSNPQSQSRNDRASLVSSANFVSPYSSRPLPVSPSGSGFSRGKSVHNSLGNVEPGYETNTGNNYLAMSLPGNHIEHNSKKMAPETQSLESGQICMTMSSSSRGKDAGQEGIVYYMQGPNGQLAPHVSYSPVEIGEMIRQQSLQQQASIKSQNSSASSSVNPSYGPYSTAAHQRLQQFQHQPQHLQFANARIIADSEVEYSPIHYASPSKNAPNPAAHMITTPHYQSPSAYPVQQSDTAASPLPSSADQFAALPHSHSEENLEDSVKHQQSQPEFYLDSSLSQQSQYSSHNMTGSSIPDVVGQSSLSQDLQRQASLESVNLSSSKESLDDLEPEIHNQGSNNSGKMVLSALSALSGNISRV